MLRQELPGGAHLRQKIPDVGTDDALIFFVCLREDQTKRDLPFPEAVDEFQVELLGGVPAVDKNKNIHEVLPFAEIVLDHLFPFFALGL